MLLAIFDVVDKDVVDGFGADLVDGVEVANKLVLVRAERHHPGNGGSQALFQGSRVEIPQMVQHQPESQWADKNICVPTIITISKSQADLAVWNSVQTSGA